MHVYPALGFSCNEMQDTVLNITAPEPVSRKSCMTDWPGAYDSKELSLNNDFQFQSKKMSSCLCAIDYVKLLAQLDFRA